MRATAFPFVLPSAPGRDGTQALAVNTRNGTVVYNVAYAVVTVSDGGPISSTNSAFAIAQCRQCTTVAVSFQLVLVVGQSNLVTPVDAAGALNDGCVACSTTAIADQMVVTLESQPSQKLISELRAALQQLGALPKLAAGGTPTAIAAAVTDVQNQVAAELQGSGLLAGQPTTSTTLAGSSGTGTAAGSNPAAGSTTTSSPPTSETTANGSSPTSTVPASTSAPPTTTTSDSTSTTIGSTSTVAPSTATTAAP